MLTAEIANYSALARLVGVRHRVSGTWKQTTWASETDPVMGARLLKRRARQESNSVDEES